MGVFEKILLGYIIAVNIFAVCITVYDKLAAINKWRRISERRLLLFAFLGSSILMYATMLIIRHKTKHNKFMIGIPLIIAIQVILIVVIDKIAFQTF